MPNRLARATTDRAEDVATLALAVERHLDRSAERPFHQRFDALGPDHGDAAAGEAHRRPSHLVGDLAPARVGQVVDGDGDGGQQLQLRALGTSRLEATLEFLGDEACR
jgi:hypothetical protein